MSFDKRHSDEIVSEYDSSVTAQSVLRRASYGPTSPTVGQRGARTRERIVAETLSLFARKGFHETTVRDISSAAEVSRATLYQYFESKEEIFVELLDECGGALLSVMRRIGPLGPTAEGFRNLRHWLVEWTEVYDKYGTMFVQWANVDLPGTATRGLVSNFLRSYNLRIANRFRRSGLVGLDSREAAIVTTSVIHRFNYLRFVSTNKQPPTEAAVHEVAVALQTILFPSTELAAMVNPAGPALYGSRRFLPPRPTPVTSDSAALRRGSSMEGLTTRSAATVNRIMAAGAQCFAESGYYRANVDDIVTRAGFARGTFYKYFDEKLDLLLSLSDECEDRMLVLAANFAKIPPGDAGREERRVWLNSYLDFRTQYIGVMRTWIDRSPTHPSLDRARERVTRLVDSAVIAGIRRSPLDGVLSVRAAEVMLIGVLERLPDAMADNARGVKQAKLVELMATVLERGIYRSQVSVAD
ncbi:MAG: transcriptional regulator, TetR family [Pseudonocardiales bacterium]|nr:transcriptional regulator, TetR family [Pseudonocardiales bacterium]